MPLGNSKNLFLSSSGVNLDAKNNILNPYGRLVIEPRPAWKKDNFFKKRANVIDDMSGAVGSTTLAWTRFSGTSVLTNTPQYALNSMGCYNALKLTTLSSFERIQKNYTTGIVPSAGILTIPCYISEMPIDYTPVPPALPIPQAASIQVLLGTDANFNASTVSVATSYIMTASQFLRAGLNNLQINHLDDGTLNTTGVAGWTYSGTTPGNADTVYPFMRLVIGGFQPLNGITPILYLGGVFQGAMSTANILINVDDGHLDTIDIANLANSMGIKLSSSLITGSVGLGAQMTWDQNRTLNDAGHDIICHSKTHPPGGLQTLTPDKLVTELSCMQDLINNGLPRVADVIALPENAFDDRIIAAIRNAGFTMARGSRPGLLNTSIGIDQPFAIGSRDVGGKTLTMVKKQIDSAQSYGATQIIYMHRIFTSTVQSMTFAAGVITVNSTAHGYSNGHVVHHRGADQPEYNVAGIIENVTANSYTFKVTGTQSATASSTAGNLRSFSPNFPLADATPPVNTLNWYWSAYVGLFKEISDRKTAGLINTITYSNLLERCSNTI